MDALPEEILHLILAQLQPSLRLKSWRPCGEKNASLYQSLARVCRVNRIWKRIAIPILYHTVELPGSIHHQPHLIDSETFKTILNVKLFFRTIARDPALVGLVHRLKVECHGDTEITPRACDDRPEGVREEELLVLLTRLPLPCEFRDHICSRALQHHDDAMVALLVPLCYKLEYLDLTVCQSLHQLADSSIMRTVGEIARSSVLFSRLETVKFRQLEAPPFFEMGPGLPPEQDEGFSVPDANALFHLPALKTFRCRGAGGPWWLTPSPFPEPLDPRKSSTVSMHLSAANVDAAAFAEMLSTHGNLRDLRFVQRECAQELHHEHVFDVLRRHGTRLERLHLHALNNAGPPGDLKPMKCLTELSIAQRSLLGISDPDIGIEELPELTDILPESLTKVKFIPFSHSAPSLPDQPQEEFEFLHEAVTDFGNGFDNRLARLCRDKRFAKLGKITLERISKVEYGFLPSGWTYETDVKGWVRIRRALHEEGTSAAT